MNIYQFTHKKDLDGISSGIVGSLLYYHMKPNHIVSYENYHTIDEAVKNFILSGEYKNYDLVIITDMGISKDTAILIEKTLNESDTTGFLLVDHHSTSEYLNKYPWAKVMSIDKNGIPISATKLLFEIFESAFPFVSLPKLRNFVSLVSDYDTYYWKEINNMEAKKMHDIFNIYSIEDFHSIMRNRILDHKKDLFSDFENHYLDIERNRVKKYIEEKISQMKVIKVLDYTIGVVFAENKEYVSELGNYICENCEDIDIAAMIDMGRKEMSYRSIRTDFNLGKDFAKLYGGGGHPNSAGSPISEEIINYVISEILIPNKNNFNYMDIGEFRDLGLLVEANRLFFHPLGLALNVIKDCKGKFKLDGIIDWREDPQGVIFSRINEEKVKTATKFIEERHKMRQERLGYIYQPINEEIE